MLERLQFAFPGRYHNTLLRTAQRRIKGWRAEMAWALVFGRSETMSPDGAVADALRNALRNGEAPRVDTQLKKGDKALVGNSAYRRYLKTTTRDAFEIDAGKIAEEARYDGIFVLRTMPGSLRFRPCCATGTGSPSRRCFVSPSR